MVEGRYRDAAKVVLVMDQLNTHSPASRYEIFPPEEARRLADRLEIHRTPKHGSWLNMAEIEFSALARDLPERVGDRLTLDRHVAAWERRRNDAEVAADWRFATADARISSASSTRQSTTDRALGWTDIQRIQRMALAR